MPGVHVHPLFFWEKYPKMTLKFALSVAAIHGAPPDFSTSRRPCSFLIASETRDPYKTFVLVLVLGGNFRFLLNFSDFKVFYKSLLLYLP